MRDPLTRALLKAFVPRCDEVENPSVRMAHGRLASIASIVANTLLCVGKGVTGLLSGSVSIVADSVNNLSDAASNVVALAGFKMAGRPADEGHPYGHGRYEYLAGLLVAVLTTSMGIALVRSSIERIASPQASDFNAVVVVVLVASILTKLWMTVFNESLSRRISSEALHATAIDSRNDVVATTAVLVAAIVSHFTGMDLDGWMGLAVGAFIVVSGVLLVRDTADPLLGRAPSPELVEHIRTKIMSYPGVLGTHDLMVHDYGAAGQFASAHVEVPAELDALSAHQLVDDIEQDFKAHDGIVMTLHADPIVTEATDAPDARRLLEEGVRAIDGRLSVHDVRVGMRDGRACVFLDCVRPDGFELTDDDLRKRVEELVHKTFPGHSCDVTIDTGYVSARQ